MVMWGNVDIEDVKQAVIYSLKKTLEQTEIPATNAVQCGNYRDHSLFAAKGYAKLILQGFLS